MGSIGWHHVSVTGSRQPRLQGLAFAMRDPFPWPPFARLVRQGESLGYDAVFLPEIGGRDALVALGALAAETEVLRLGTGVIPMSSRTPMLAAMAAAAVHERSLGRLVLGIGTGPAVPGALDRLRGLVGTLRRLFAGDPVEIEGRLSRLSLVPEEPVPIWISALGPRAVRLAGEIADGVLLNWCSPERVRLASSQLREGAESAGRDPADVTVAVYVRASLGASDQDSVRALQAAAGEYASYPARSWGSMRSAGRPRQRTRRVGPRMCRKTWSVRWPWWASRPRPGSVSRATGRPGPTFPSSTPYPRRAIRSGPSLER
jgi:alkanesulfonate monooxygenase SsuD/methylene tetrahydromethanopterin reductase-like flavin-dependent oxidoreductase (luciferase family)